MMISLLPSVICTLCTGFFSLAIIKGLLWIIFYHRRPFDFIFTENFHRLGVFSARVLPFGCIFKPVVPFKRKNMVCGCRIWNGVLPNCATCSSIVICFLFLNILMASTIPDVLMALLACLLPLSYFLHFSVYFFDYDPFWNGRIFWRMADDRHIIW